MAKTEAQTPKTVEFAVVNLLHATQEWTRAYDAWTHEPDDEHEVQLDEAERKLEEAQHEVAKREAIARLIARSEKRDAPR